MGADDLGGTTMPTPVRADDVTRMTDALFIEKSWKSPSASKFWVLLVLATIIATAGVTYSIRVDSAAGTGSNGPSGAIASITDAFRGQRGAHGGRVQRDV